MHFIYKSYTKFSSHVLVLDVSFKFAFKQTAITALTTGKMKDLKVLTEGDYNHAVFARMAARFPVTAWNPDLMLVTEHLDPHDSHWRKKILVSFCRRVSGDLQV